MGNRDTVETFFKLLNGRRLDELAKLMIPDVITEWPQSGERIRGVANSRAIMENYPGLPTGEVHRVIGAEDQWVLTPNFTLMGVAGTGDHYTVEARTKYPNGETWASVHIFQFENGKISKITEYYAAPLPPPEWRSAWVERMDGVEKAPGSS